MPTKYTNATEQMVLEKYRKKIDQDEGVAHFEKSESPDGIIKTQAGQIIGVEVTSAFRTVDSVTNPNKKHEMAIFLNRFGLYDPENPSVAILNQRFEGDPDRQYISRSKERIQEKEANNGYRNFAVRFSKSVLIIYLDDLFIDSRTLEKITGLKNVYSQFLLLFDDAYIYIRPTDEVSSHRQKHIGGLYLIGQSKKA